MKNVNNHNDQEVVKAELICEDQIDGLDRLQELNPWEDAHY